MICDLCRERSDHIVRVNSWVVCQWCVTNNVLDRALHVESVLTELSGVVAKTSAKHQRDVTDVTVAESEVEVAYANLTTALNDLAASTALSKESLRQAQAAQKALEDYRDSEGRRSQEQREHR